MTCKSAECGKNITENLIDSSCSGTVRPITKKKKHMFQIVRESLRVKSHHSPQKCLPKRDRNRCITRIVQIWREELICQDKKFFNISTIYEHIRFNNSEKMLRFIHESTLLKFLQTVSIVFGTPDNFQRRNWKKWVYTVCWNVGL